MGRVVKSLEKQHEIKSYKRQKKKTKREKLHFKVLGNLIEKFY